MGWEKGARGMRAVLPTSWVLLPLVVLSTLACTPSESPAPPQQLRLWQLAPEAHRTTLELEGEHRPGLAGAGRAIEITLPPPAVLSEADALELEAHLGLRPPASGAGSTEPVPFRVEWVEGPGTSRTLVEEELAADATGWRRVRVTLEGLEGGGELVLTAGPRGVWGTPRLWTGQRPSGWNVVVVAVDTLRADSVSPLLTPHLERFARRSLRFPELTAPAPWTLPSFATLATGLDPRVHGAGRRLDGPSWDGSGPKARLPTATRTLAEELAAAGLVTGSIYNNVYLTPAFGLEQGFDEHLGFHYSTRANVLVDRALAWLDDHRRRRFFLFLHLLDPHTPYTPPPKRFCWEALDRLPQDAVRDGCRVTRHTGEPDIPAERRPWVKALYEAEVSFTDDQLGRLFAHLEEQGRFRDTVILFVSDHGEEFWEHQAAERERGYQPVADHGHSLYRELLHVPAALHVPGTGREGDGGREITAPVSLADFFPTLLALAGRTPPASQGRQLLVAKGEAGKEGETWSPVELAPDHPRLGGFLLYGPDRSAVIEGPWKLVYPEDGELPVELYHLRDDPEEMRDLAKERPQVVERLRRTLRRLLAEAETLRQDLKIPRSQPAAHLSPEQVESLQALGYR